MHWPSSLIEEHSSNMEAAASHAKPYGFVEFLCVSVPSFFVLHFHHKLFGALLLNLFVFFFQTMSSTVGQGSPGSVLQGLQTAILSLDTSSVLIEVRGSSCLVYILFMLKCLDIFLSNIHCPYRPYLLYP